MLTYGEATQEHPLPFIRKSKRGKVESYWDVTPTGDYIRDSRTGTDYALAFMASEHPRQIGTGLLPILHAMAKAGAFQTKAGPEQEGDSIAFSFICTICHCSVDGWTPANLAHYRKWKDEGEATLDRISAERAAERSANARKAALAGAAKRMKAKRRRAQ